MDRIKIRYFIDAGLLITLLSFGITGIIKFRRLWSLLGITVNYDSLPMHELTLIHDWTGFVFIFLVIAHLALNWEWIVLETKNMFVKREEPDMILAKKQIKKRK